MTFITSSSFASGTGSTLTTPAGGVTYFGTDGITTIQIQDSSANNTEMKISGKKQDDKIVNPALYFRLIKSKLNKLEQDKLKKRLKHLYQGIRKLDECGQQAAFENFAKQISIVVRESEAVACGYDKFVLKENIDKFIKAKYKYKNLEHAVHWDTLEKFPRIIPDNIIKIIKDMKEKNLFDEYWVLYLDYTKEELKTNKEKIREKDPILFGKYKFNDERYYFVADWIDEKCHLTLKELISEFEKIKDAKVNDVEAINDDYIQKINKYVMAQTDRLAQTNNSNYQELMKVEEQARAELKEELKNEVKVVKKPWWKLW